MAQRIELHNDILGLCTDDLEGVQKLFEWATKKARTGALGVSKIVVQSRYKNHYVLVERQRILKRFSSESHQKFDGRHLWR